MINEDKMQNFLDLVADVCFENGMEMPEGMFGVKYNSFFGAYHVSYEDDKLPRPLNTRLWLTRYPTSLDDKGAKNVAGSLKTLFGDMDRVINELEGYLTRTKALLAGSDAKIINFRAGMVSSLHGQTEITGVADILLIDEGLKPNTLSYEIDNVNGGDWSKLKRAAKAQAARRSKAKEGLCADAITIKSLAKMTKRDRTALVTLLAREPRPTTATVGPGGPRDKWSSAQLRRLGHKVPKDIEAVWVKDGRLVCRVRLGDTATWTDSVITVARQQLPEITILSLTGLDVGAVVEHEALTGLGPITKVTQGRGVLRIRVDTPALPLSV